MVLADGALSIFDMLMSWLDKKWKALFFLSYYAKTFGLCFIWNISG